MKENIADKLLDCIDKKTNPCIVGLDPALDQIPDHLKKSKDRNSFEAVRDVIIEFNKLIINAVEDIVPAVKIQTAFYEAYGSKGIEALEETIIYAKSKGLIVIEDAKRNDIGSTAKAYAEGHLGKVMLNDGELASSFDVDMITVNPYLGSDSIEPFIEACKKYEKGIFILAKTSNKSSREIQNKTTKKGKTIYEIVAQYIDEAGKDMIGERGYSAIGAVVGATYPREAKKLRKQMPKTIFLAPGYGAQGGKAKDITHCFNSDGYGAIISSSRGIIFAYKEEPYKSMFCQEEFYLASRKAAKDMRIDIIKNLEKQNKLPKGW